MDIKYQVKESRVGRPCCKGKVGGGEANPRPVPHCSQPPEPVPGLRAHKWSSFPPCPVRWERREGQETVTPFPQGSKAGWAVSPEVGLVKSWVLILLFKMAPFPSSHEEHHEGGFPLFSGRTCSESLAGKLTGASPRLVHPSLLNSPVHSSLASCRLLPTLLSALVSCDSLSTCQSLACRGSGCAVTSLLWRSWAKTSYWLFDLSSFLLVVKWRGNL